MSLFHLNKKAQIGSDVFKAIVFIFTFSVITIIATVVFTAMINEYQTVLATDSDVVRAGEKFKAMFGIFDKIMAIVMILFIIGIAVTSAKLQSRPIFFIVTLILAPLFGLVSYFFNYIFIQIITQPAFAAVLTTFPITILITTNLHWISLALIVVSSIATFAKRPEAQFLT